MTGTPPAIVLVQPQLGDNIGAAARAMMNCGLDDLRLVAPRDGWPNPRAWTMASGAEAILDAARLFDTVEAAVADLHWLAATTARSRGMAKPVLTARAAAAHIPTIAGRAGVLFGPERTGLTNDHTALADAVLTVPLNPAHTSLNLAQAVLLVGYEWYQAGVDAPPVQPLPEDSQPATRDQVFGLFAHLESELDACGFLASPEMRPVVVRNLRNLFHRAALTDQEVRTLRGVVKCLAHGRHRRKETS